MICRCGVAPCAAKKALGVTNVRYELPVRMLTHGGSGNFRKILAAGGSCGERELPVDCYGMVWLVETNFPAPGKLDFDDRTPPGFLHW